ncbi:Hypothetical protein PHPALM_17305 [Phytophthora palmivora]|uniref:Uncharacterized protein n=1 Tax=Phytophthora palmivora TaxID=4796 RepID=A0A2P4XMN9_9STRA|nr:Hypothetical protein PHPALM_17305 [Phytophthora palmivora]
MDSRRTASVSFVIVSNTRCLPCILKASTDAFKLFRYTYGRVPVDGCIAQSDCSNWTVQAVKANGHCARNTRSHSFFLEAFNLDALREHAEAFSRSQYIFVEITNKL